VLPIDDGNVVKCDQRLDSFRVSCRDDTLHVSIGLFWLASVVLKVSREVQRGRFSK
jgi:hypothetical protein